MPALPWHPRGPWRRLRWIVFPLLVVAPSAVLLLAGVPGFSGPSLLHFSQIRRLFQAKQDALTSTVHHFYLSPTIAGSGRPTPAYWMHMLRALARKMPPSLTVKANGQSLRLAANELRLSWNARSETGYVLAFYTPVSVSPPWLGRNPSVYRVTGSTLQFFSMITLNLEYDAQGYLEQDLQGWLLAHQQAANHFPNYLDGEALIAQRNHGPQIQVWLPQSGSPPSSLFSGHAWANSFDGFSAQMLQWLAGTP